MKKIGLICATLLACGSLAGCGNTQSHKASSSSSSSAKVVKHHKTHKKANKKKQNSSSSSTSTASQSSQQQATSPSTTQQSTSSSQPEAWQAGSAIQSSCAERPPTSEDQARAMLGGANGDLQATRTSNGWTFSGDGYTATVGDDGSISHN